MYHELKMLAKHMGKQIGTYGSNGNFALKDCQDACDNDLRCHSIAVCPRDRCYFYDEIMDKDVPQIVSFDNCFTSYQTCSGIRQF